MARTRLKWQCIFISYIILVNVFTKSLPIKIQLPVISSGNADVVFHSYEPVSNPDVTEVFRQLGETTSEQIVENKNVTVDALGRAAARNIFIESDIRPGQRINNYQVELTINENSFSGQAVISITVTQATMEDELILYAEDLEITQVQTGVVTADNSKVVTAVVDDGQLEISPADFATSYVVTIDFVGQYSNSGLGLHRGTFNQDTYLAMNLHPTYARRVFPCVDEPSQLASTTISFKNMDYTHVTLNSKPEDTDPHHFRPLSGPIHVWGMLAHNFVNINIPIANVLLYGRAGVANQDGQASVAINSYFTALNEWTDKEFGEIINEQDGRLSILAMPDVSTDWNALSTIGIWEPHLLMETTHSVKQRKTALIKIAEAMAKQWFGYAVFPQNWRYEWVVAGMASYAGWEVFKQFQGDGTGTDVTLLDVNTLFVTEVIQESLLRDSYLGSLVLEPSDDLFEEEDIRDLMSANGMIKYKAPALLRMMRVVLGDEDTDLIRSAAITTFRNQNLRALTSLNFVDNLKSGWLSNDNGMVGDLSDYLEPWITTNGYPLIRVTRVRGSGVFLTQERFGFSTKSAVEYEVPITYTTSVDADFGEDRIYPILMMGQTQSLSMTLGDEDWVIFNIQGQGYYRVHYDADLWERLIEALEEPETREVIHPLNRATLLDDSFNLARAGILDYEVPLRMSLTMLHESDYPVWRAYIRNMEFLRKRLIALVEDDDDLDPDIYLRMVRRSMTSFEENIGFTPDVSVVEPVMQTLTRGLVMEHACKAGYQPCIAAAVDWFYNPDNNQEVNPNIPHDIRPAVYCTMVKEAGEAAIEALQARRELEANLYERVVILEALACSEDEGFINELLQATIANDSPYTVEERVKIFTAVAESSASNANLARAFISRSTAAIRNMYGGNEKFEEIIFILADNMADEGMAADFRIWTEGQNNNLDDNQMAAYRALGQVVENQNWVEQHLEEVYEWIDENDAPTLMVSIIALGVSMMVMMFVQ